jgi:hypothetical protein
MKTILLPSLLIAGLAFPMSHAFANDTSPTPATASSAASIDNPDPFSDLNSPPAANPQPSPVAPAAPISASPAPTKDNTTFSQDEVLSAVGQIASGASDLGEELAKGIAGVIAHLGNPTGIIVGSEGQGAFFVGYRKGAGQVIFKATQSTASAQQLYWRAPSIGFNVGGSASRVAILIYGITDYNKLMQKFGSVEGSFHSFAGGSISYLNNLKGDPAANAQLAYVAIGIGLDAGVAIEDLTFSQKDNWMPF